MECGLEYNNSTLKNQTLTTAENIKIILIPQTIILVFVLTTNLMLIYGFYKTSRPFTIITKLFIYLSVIDIAMILFRTFYAFQAFLGLQIPCLMAHIIILLMEFTYMYGVSIFATISFLRYWSIKKPLYSIDAKHIHIGLAVQAIVCGLIIVGVLVMIYLKIHLNQVILFFFLITQFLAVAFVLTVNITSYKKLKSMKKNSGLSDNVVNTSTQRQKILSEANTCLLYITVFYILCPLPMLIWTFVSIFKIDILNIEMHSRKINLFVLSQICFMSNSGINSLIVILRTKNLREHYKLNCCCSNNS